MQRGLSGCGPLSPRRTWDMTPHAEFGAKESEVWVSGSPYNYKATKQKLVR